MFCHDIYNRHSWQIGLAVSSTGTLNRPCCLHWWTVSVPQIHQLEWRMHFSVSIVVLVRLFNSTFIKSLLFEYLYRVSVVFFFQLTLFFFYFFFIFFSFFVCISSTSVQTSNTLLIHPTGTNKWNLKQQY